MHKMKKIAGITLSILCLVGFYACSPKKTDSGSGMVLNYLTLSINGTTYRDTVGVQTGSGLMMSKESNSHKEGATRNYQDICRLVKSDTDSKFSFTHVGTVSFPFSITIANAIGPATGLGIFKITKADMKGENSSRLKNDGNLIGAEDVGAWISRQADSTACPVDSLKLNFVKASETHIEATFEIWTSFDSLQQKMSGTIEWNTADTK